METLAAPQAHCPQNCPQHCSQHCSQHCPQHWPQHSVSHLSGGGRGKTPIKSVAGARPPIRCLVVLALGPSARWANRLELRLLATVHVNIFTKYQTKFHSNQKFQSKIEPVPASRLDTEDMLQFMLGQTEVPKPYATATTLAAALITSMYS